MAEDKERFRRAVDFMKMLGVSHTVVAPLLRRLIKLYDNEWALIEEENYRALADSYFEHVETTQSREKSHMVTRNKARQSGLNDGVSRRIQEKESDPVLPHVQSSYKKTNEQGTAMNSLPGKKRELDCERDEEKQGRSIQGERRSTFTCDSPGSNLQVDCISYKETRAHRFNIHMEETLPKKARIQAAALPATGMPHDKSLAPTSTCQIVKEEPLELSHDILERKNEIVLFQPSMLYDVVPQTAFSPSNAVSMLQQDLRNGMQPEEDCESPSSIIKPDTRQIANANKESRKETLGLINHNVGNGVLRQMEDGLSAIAVMYGSMLDEGLEVDKDSLFPSSHYSPVEKTDANGKGLAERRMTSTVKQEQETLFQSTNSQQQVIMQTNKVKGKESVGKQSIVVVKQEPESQCREIAVPSRKAYSRKNKSSGTKFSILEERDRLAIVPQQLQQSRWDDIPTHRHNFDDISRGQEKVPITVSISTNATLPEAFYYISKNITYQNAYVNFSLARIGDEDCCGSCYGDCLKSYPPCYCARETGGEFAYDCHGCLRETLLQEALADKRNTEASNRLCYCERGICPVEQGKNHSNPEPCKGHLMRKFVKECWSKCGCDMYCGNRVVQKGISCKLQVFFMSRGKGWGVRTLEDLSPGTFVCEYVGEILTNIELDMRNSTTKGHSDHYPVLLDADWSSENMLQDEELLCLDATNYGNVARFINHRCYDANLVDIPVEIESPDHHYYHIAFFTTRLVKAFEELTWVFVLYLH